MAPGSLRGAAAGAAGTTALNAVACLDVHRVRGLVADASVPAAQSQ